ncbi:MAG: hypothetical protein D6689_05740 [Deltaproteobacteria bacterium]|nr:MAG: hypothetical protein D6689_05740 [Deltaproteobacteria bacterium]
MDYRRFEREFLRLAFTTPIELSPASVAFYTGVSVREAEQHMQRLVDLGVLEVASDDDGHIKYRMPDRPPSPVGAPGAPPPYPAPPPHAPPRAIVVRGGRGLAPSPVTPGQATAAMFLNAMVCPGIGSLVAGRTRAGIGQLALFALGVPLIVVAIGLPMIVAAWTWGVATGAQLIAEANGG